MTAGLPLTSLGMAVVAFLGLLFGSFGGLLVSRVPVGEGVVRGRSRCDGCGRPLRAVELVPVLSWALLRGRCRTCGAAITPLWTVLELLTAAAFVLAAFVAEDVWQFGLVAPFFGILIALTVTDLRTFLLPDAVVIPALLVAVAAVAGGDVAGGGLDLPGALIGAASFGGALWVIAAVARRVYGQDAMGLGDVKLAALIGLVIGSLDLPSVAVAAGAAVLLGGVVGLAALALGMGRKAAVPFGPMLAVGAVVAVAVGPRLVDAYLGLYA